MNMKKVLLVLNLLLLSSLIYAAPQLESHFQDRFLVVLNEDIVVDKSAMKLGKPVIGATSFDRLLESRDIVKMEKYLTSATSDDVVDGINLANVYRLTFPAGTRSVDQVMSDFSEDSNVLYTEHEVINRPSYIPDDPNYASQWFLPKIGAPETWALWDIPGGVTPGDVNIILASSDTGVQYTHPDLWKQTWVNQAEVPAGIFASVDTDNDGIVTPVEVVAHITDLNVDGKVDLQDALHASSPFMDGIDGDDWDTNPTTFVDDLLGWDLSGATPTSGPDNDPMGAQGPFLISPDHGTHVGGLLCAATNNTTGIASVIYNGTLMPVKCAIDSDLDQGIWNAYDGLLYAAKAGADIINASWGSSFYSPTNQAIANLITNTYGAIIVSSAGNGNTDGTPNGDPHYPSGYENVLSVTAVSFSDVFSWANYGDGVGFANFDGVDISAPGEGIHSTTYSTENSYESWAGTSMASPIVASSLGLLKSIFPDSSNSWIIQNLLDWTDPIDHINPDFAGQLGSGRLNIYNAIGHLIIPDLSYDSHSLQMSHDIEDKQLSPGEEALMRVNLSNSPGWIDASDVDAVLKSTSEYVTITDSLGHYSSINSGSVGVNILDRFTFSVSIDAPSEKIPFTLELTANPTSEHPYSATLEFLVEISMWQPNFPFTADLVKSGNAVVDLDGDGTKEIVFGAYDSLIHAVQIDGSELAGFPIVLANVVDATPAVGDVDRDGDLEVVIGGRDKNLYVIQHDGQIETIYTSDGFMWATPTLYDIDGNGDLEIIAMTYSGNLEILHHDGTAFNSNFPINLGKNNTAAVSVGDINDDGNLNIVTTSTDKMLHALGLDGLELPGFPIVLNDAVKSSVVLANLDGSAGGELDIIFGSNDNNIHAYDASGTKLWSYSASGQDVKINPGVSDIESDGDLEIIFIGASRDIYAVDHTGTLLSGWPLSTGGSTYSSPVIADIDDDGMAEIFVGATDYYLYGLNLDGSNLIGFPAKLSSKVHGTPTIDDLDGDGDAEIVVGTDDDLSVLDLPGQMARTKRFWSMHRGNLHRTGAHLYLPVSIATDDQLPGEYKLYKNYPNPFNPSTSIGFDVPISGAVDLEIIDIRGRVVETLISDHMNPGVYSVVWDGRFNGKPASAGLYLYRLSTPNGVFIKKMTLLK